MNKLKKIFAMISSLLAIGSVGFGVKSALHSNLFLLRLVEINNTMQNPPLSDRDILRIANAPIFKATLFELDLKEIERKLLVHDWIRKVRIQKKFFGTLSITVFYREPKAVMQSPKGSLSYIDSEGKVFGTVDLLRMLDLPVFSGFGNQNTEKLKEGLEILTRWEKSFLNRLSQVSSIYWESERGFRLLVLYTLKSSGFSSASNHDKQARVMIDIGQEVDTNFDGKLTRLLSVFRYLSGNSIAARQIWADAGKKIVVKTAHGS